LGAATDSARLAFAADHRAALAIASRANTVKTRKADDAIFEHWCSFCAEVGCAPGLQHVSAQEDRLAYVLVFALRFRQTGQRGKPVRADTVDKALLAVGKGITNLGFRDPRKQNDGSNQPLLASFLKALRDDDDPASRSYPVNITIIRALGSLPVSRGDRWTTYHAHRLDLIIVAYFWLLRPGEYTNSPEEGTRSRPFEFRHIHLTIGDTPYTAPAAPLNDTNLARLTYGTLEFADQKNAVKGEQVGHKPTADPLLCPVKALYRIAFRLRQARATPTTPIYKHYNHVDRKWYDVTSRSITAELRRAATSVQHYTGIDPALISARSLRPGGATALLCAGVDPDRIQLLGRWKSDAMFRYLRIQAATHAHNYAQSMLTHGTFSFVPQTYAAGGLPREAPADMAAILAHDALYDDA
jgi:hypothetical protein